MKESVKETVLGAIAKVALVTAKKACGAASMWDFYQPKEPAALKKMMKDK